MMTTTILPLLDEVSAEADFLCKEGNSVCLRALSWFTGVWPKLQLLL